MLLHVVLQVVVLWECFATQLTPVRVYAGVQPIVHSQGTHAGESFLALFALEPLAAVQARVHGQRSRIDERLPAGDALEWPFARMAPPVDHQIAGAGEILATDFALVRPNALVHLQMGPQVLLVAVRTVADVALVGSIGVGAGAGAGGSSGGLCLMWPSFAATVRYSRRASDQ